MIVAGIGSRETPEDILVLMEALGRRVVEQGHTLTSGNALGADQAFQRGGNAADSSKVHVFLPWVSYNAKSTGIMAGNVVSDEPPGPWTDEGKRLYEIAENYHGAWHQLRQGGKKMMVRNIQIVEDAQLVIAYAKVTEDKPWGGGTGQGIRFARDNSIRVIDLFTEEGRRLVQDISL